MSVKKYFLYPDQLFGNERPGEQIMRELDQDMSGVMKQSLPHDVKLNLYQNALLRHMVLKDADKNRQATIVEQTIPAPATTAPTTAASTSTDATDEATVLEQPTAAADTTAASSDDEPTFDPRLAFLHGRPRLFASARRLIKKLDLLDEVKWNRKGELVIKGRVISNSHMEDIISHLVSDVKKDTQTQPRGVPALINLLRESGGVPTGVIVNKFRKADLSFDFSGSDPLATSTPIPSRSAPKQSGSGILAGYTER